jgi:hypothetical protein
VGCWLTGLGGVCGIFWSEKAMYTAWKTSWLCMEACESCLGILFQSLSPKDFQVLLPEVFNQKSWALLLLELPITQLTKVVIRAISNTAVLLIADLNYF